MDRIAIIGTGLIGTSFGLALKKAGLKVELVGFDSERGVADKAKKRGALDKAVGNLSEAVRGARVVILATPVPAMRELLEFIASELDEGAVVTDTGSTKASVLEWADELLPPSVSFVGGHPMAGSEQSGPGAANENLFRGAVYLVCPSKRAHADAARTVSNLAETIGATPHFIDAVEHDSYVAAVSHLPMLLSVALVATTSQSPSWRDMYKLAASGYRDLSRLAAGDPVMHLGICATNHENLVHWLDETIKQLYEMRTLLKEGDTTKLEALFYAARDARARWVGGVPPASDGTVPMPKPSEVISSFLWGDALTKRLKARAEAGSQPKPGDQKR